MQTNGFWSQSLACEKATSSTKLAETKNKWIFIREEKHKLVNHNKSLRKYALSLLIITIAFGSICCFRR